MKKILKVLLGFVVVVAVFGAINGAQQADKLAGKSAQLSSFKGIKACDDGMTLGELVGTYALPNSAQWQDMDTNEYGPVVGFIADFDSGKPEPSHIMTVGMQAQYAESGLKEGVYNFQPVALEVMSSDGKQHRMPSNIIAQFLPKLCEGIVKNAATSAP